MNRILLSLICLLAAAAAALAQADWPSGGIPAGLGPPTAMPSAVAAKITVRASQGTNGGTPLMGDEVLVQISHQGRVMAEEHTSLDFRGVATVDTFKVAMPCEVTVTVSHGGAQYGFGGMVSPEHPQTEVQAPIHDTTQQPPPWQILMHHVMVDRHPKGLYVTEIILGNNPTDRTWLGEKTLPIPPGAIEVKLGDGFGDGVEAGKGRILNHLPFMPGKMKFRYEYILPAGADGKVAIPLTAAAPTQQMLVLLAEGTIAKAEGLESVGLQDFEEHKYQMYRQSDLATGATAMLSIAGLPVAGRSPTDTAKTIAAVGGGLILLCGLGYVLFRPARKPVEAAAENAPRGKARKGTRKGQR